MKQEVKHIITGFLKTADTIDIALTNHLNDYNKIQSICNDFHEDIDIKDLPEHMEDPDLNFGHIATTLNKIRNNTPMLCVYSSLEHQDKFPAFTINLYDFFLWWGQNDSSFANTIFTNVKEDKNFLSKEMHEVYTDLLKSGFYHTIKNKALEYIKEKNNLSIEILNKMLEVLLTVDEQCEDTAIAALELLGLEKHLTTNPYRPIDNSTSKIMVKFYTNRLDFNDCKNMYNTKRSRDITMFCYSQEGMTEQLKSFHDIEK